MDEETTRPTRRPPVAPAALFAAICLAPLIFRAARPSIYSDDVTRIEQLRMRGSFGDLLFIPFNEHIAPVFQAVSWLSWTLAGARLANAPLAFTIASLVPHILCLIALGVFLRRELNSATAAMAGVALFGLSGAISETYHWYSASSFTWALLGTIAAIDATGRATTASGGRRVAWLVLSLLASLLAPAASGIGLLAGPAAALRLAADGSVSGVARKAVGFVPVLGTAAYFAICSLFRYRDLLADSLARRVDVAAALRNIACAPADVLLPGLVGQGSIERLLPDSVAISVSIACLLAALFWAWRDTRRRPLILVALAMIAGGYVLTFGPRSYRGSNVVLENDRYHLFPQFGLALLLAMALQRWLGRFDATARRSLTAGAVVAALVLAVQIGAIRQHASFFRWPGQARTLAAIERLAEVCRREGITRDQCIASLVPIRNRWFNAESNALMLLPRTVATSTRTGDLRAVLLGSLDQSEREALCGGMDISRQLTRREATPTDDAVAVGRLVQTFAVSETSSPGRWKASGWASFLEFELATTGGDPTRARILSLPVAGPVELWWSEDGLVWSEGRSVRWWPSRSAEPRDWSVLLDDLPHWPSSPVRRVRIVPRRRGEIAVGVPRLLR